MNPFNFRSRQPQVEFCERCGRVCDSNCRAEAVRDQARMRVPEHGWRVA